MNNPLMSDVVGDIVGEAPPIEKPAAPKTVAEKPAKRPAPPKRPSKPRPSAERAGQTVQIKARFSEEEAADIERFTRALSGYVGSKIKTSDITRALWSLAIRSEEGLADVSAKAPKMARPSYGSGLDMAQYRDQITEFVLVALKNTPKA